MKSILFPIAFISLIGNWNCPEQKNEQKLLQKKSEVLQEKKSPTEIFFNPKAYKNKVDSIYNSLSPKERAAQMIMYASSTSPKLGYPYSKVLPLIEDNTIGGIVFLKGNMKEFKKQVDELNNRGNSIKPMYACDCEPSLMNGKWEGSTPVKKANLQLSLNDIQENTTILNKDIKHVGVHINFAPVADNATNKDVISNRAFGNDNNKIIDFSKEFIKISQNEKIATSIKHFPGHGNVKGDSHKNLVFINGELTELNTFESIIKSEYPPLTVMVGHIAVKNNPKWDTKGLPSTISRKIVTDLLRNELGYEGIITTDAMNMLGVANVPDADWKAVLAGVDLVLMPTNPKALNQKIVSALEKNDETSKQIEESIKRIIKLKITLGVI